jgi:signal transduction histidine kinase
MRQIKKNTNTVLKIFTDRSGLRILLFSIFAFIVLAGSLTFFALSLGKPYMGVTLSFKSQGWEVENVDTSGMANQSGIRKGDRPVKINGQPADIFLEKYEVNRIVYGLSFEDLTVIDSNSQPKTATLSGSSLPLKSVIEQLEWLFVCVIFWITGFYAFFKRPGNLAAFMFCLCGLALGLVLSGNMASAIAIPGALHIHIAISIFSPWLLLHYFHILPEERARLHRSFKIYLIYLIPLATLIIYPLFGDNQGQPVAWFRTFRFIEYGVGLLAVLIVAFVNYRQFVSARTRQQMKIMLVTLILALIPFIVLNIIPVATMAGQTSGLSIIFLVFIPIGFTYAVVTQNLLDIDVIIRRSIIYALVTLFMAAIFSVGIFFVLKYETALGDIEKILIAIASGLVASILFGPVKKGIEVTVDRLFYKDRYDYHQVVKMLSDSLNTLNKFTDISRVIITTIVQTLNIAGACLLVYAGDSLETSISQGTFAGKADQKKLMNIISQADGTTKFPDSASGLDPELAFIVPLKAAEKEIGLLCLSQKISRQKYTSDDIYLIQGIMAVSAIALRSAMLLRDAGSSNTFIDVVSDKIRKPVSNIIGFSEFLLRRDPPKETREQWLENIIENGHQIVATADNLMHIRRIQLKKIDIKLNAVTIPDVLEEELALIRNTTKNHEFINNIAPELPDGLIDRQKFGKIIGNILDNAVRYSPDGGRVTTSVYYDESRQRIVVSISDEGIGISSADKASLFTMFNPMQRTPIGGARGIGLSLYIAKEWVEAMGGEIWLESEANHGAAFFVAVPVQLPGAGD